MSSAPHAFPFHIGDYLRDTRGLSLAEHGAYLMLMLEYYAKGGPLPAEPKTLYRICGARTARERQAVDQVLAQFFTNGDGLVRNPRCDLELDGYRERRRKSQDSANVRWDKSRKDNGTHDATALPPQSSRASNAAFSLSPSENQKHALAQAPDAFERFWKTYPKKRSKADARKAWNSLQADATLVEQILAAIETAKASSEWRDARFIPYPAKWLKAHGWEDERSAGQAEFSDTAIVALGMRYSMTQGKGEPFGEYRKRVTAEDQRRRPK